MSGSRELRHPPEALALKVASKALIRAAGGTDGAGETIGARQQRMSDCGNPHTRDFLRIDEVAALEDVTAGAPNHPLITRTLARRQGYSLVRLPAAIPARADLLKLLGEQAKEGGDIAAAILSALADGVVTKREAGSVRVQIAELITVAVAMDAELAAIEVGEGE